MGKKVEEMSEKEREALLKQILQDLKQILSENRYLHSVSTMKKAKELAKIYQQNEQIVMLTAVAHDIAKEMTKEEFFAYAEKNKIPLEEFDTQEKVALHGKIGADIVAKKYGFSKEMQDAIYYHTTARANMTMLDKIIFLADKTEERREGEDAEKLRTILQEEGLDEAILWDIDYYTIPRMIAKERLLHVNSIQARNAILAKKKKIEEAKEKN